MHWWPSFVHLLHASPRIAVFSICFSLSAAVCAHAQAARLFVQILVHSLLHSIVHPTRVVFACSVCTRPQLPVSMACRWPRLFGFLWSRSSVIPRPGIGVRVGDHELTSFTYGCSLCGHCISTAHPLCPDWCRGPWAAPLSSRTRHSVLFAFVLSACCMGVLISVTSCTVPAGAHTHFFMSCGLF